MSHDIHEKAKRFADVLFDRVFRHSHSLRDLALGQALDLAQCEGLATFARQLGNQVGDASQLLVSSHSRFRRCFLGGDPQAVDLSNGFDGDDSHPTHVLQYDGVSHGEHVCAWILNVRDTFKLYEDRIGLLHDVIDLKSEAASALKPRAQSRFMR